ncbi:DUF5675 family protein [Marinobacter adhaerens]|uniref:DUF5675 family protein n=1 Tax=Marinobacter adhaerens TaxID=1033846 RepID=UPI003D29CB5F
MRPLLLCTAFFLLLLSSHAVYASKPFEIEIKRTSHNSNSITGELHVNGKFVSHTLELPYKNNESYVSSIPAGTYDAYLRYDKDDKWRLQLEDVPNRSGIQIHIGNWPSQIEGCVLVGTKVINSTDTLEGSEEAYKRLKRAFYAMSNPTTSPNPPDLEVFSADNPISSPDVRVTVEISYYPTRTTFKSPHITLQYQGSGQWKVKERPKLKVSELFRNTEFIAMKSELTLSDSGISETFTDYIGVPLFGGEHGYKSKNGKENWKKQNIGEMIRKN